jgi:hypothetical protein
MKMSNFDPNKFLDATITEVQTRRPNLPPGIDLIGTIGEVKITPWQGKMDPSKAGIRADVPITLDTSMVKDQPPQVTITYGIMLDLNDAGLIDLSPGRNGKLRGFREALGMNAPGSAFNWRQVQGRQVRAKISHRSYENEIYDDISAVAKV